MRILLDACVLYPAPLRDFLLRVAAARAFVPLWSDDILDEMVRSVVRDRPDLDPARLNRTVQLMNSAFPQARVTGYGKRIKELELPDVGDRHVLASAIAGRAEVIATFNLKDFPAEVLRRHGTVALHPDVVVGQLLDMDADAVVRGLSALVASLKLPPQTAAEVLETLAHVGLPESAARIAGRWFRSE